MNIDWLKLVQRSGWTIESADDGTCTVKCPTRGCQMRARFKTGTAIPLRDQPCHTWDNPVESFSDVRDVLKARRQELGLIIPEVEEISGIAGDHLAKFEKLDTVRMPNAQTFIEWAQSLGFQVILRPTDLPPMTLRYIAETRSKAEARKRRFAIERGREEKARRDGRAV